MNYSIHEVASLMPRMSADEYAELVKDIREHGQIVPIVAVGNEIIDGRHRYEVCIEIGISPNIEQYYGDTSLPALISLVMSTNEKRRHLSSSQ